MQRKNAKLYVKRYREKNPEKVRIRRNNWSRNNRTRRRTAILNKLGNKCKMCGNSDFRVLQIDHIYGGGTQHRKKIPDRNYYKDVLLNIEKFQLLCANCNWIKRYENKENNKYGGVSNTEHHITKSTFIQTKIQYK